MLISRTIVQPNPQLENPFQVNPLAIIVFTTCRYGFTCHAGLRAGPSAATLKRAELVAHAIGIGLLREEEVPGDVREMLSAAIDYYDEYYEIDDDDPLSRLRGQ
jgi:hypothetical protein